MSKIWIPKVAHLTYQAAGPEPESVTHLPKMEGTPHRFVPLLSGRTPASRWRPQLMLFDLLSKPLLDLMEKLLKVVQCASSLSVCIDCRVQYFFPHLFAR